MLRIVFLSALAALGAAQVGRDPKTAIIEREERYLQVNGQFGAAYQQDDGVQFKEESDADGTRRGSYSYVDPTGQRRTVNYVAGKNGFQPVGDHIPAAPAPVVNPQPQYNSPPQGQSYNPAPVSQYNGPSGEDNGEWFDDTKVDYPANSPSNAPAPGRGSWNSAPAPVQPAPVQPSWNAAPAPQSSWNAAPTPQPSWNAAPAPQPSWNAAPAPQPSWNAATTPQPSWNAAPQQTWTQQPAQRWNAPIETTPAPHRFYPPGKLNLNRSPDGFSYSFQKS